MNARLRGGGMRRFLSFFILVILFFSGCIRLTGTAGYWKKGSEDESPKSKQVSFDTQDIVQPDRTKGSITVANPP